MNGERERGRERGRKSEDGAVLRLLQSIPAMTRWCNMTFLDERLSPATLVVVTSHSVITLGHLSNLLLRSKGERVYNDAGAFIAALTTCSYLVAAVLKRRTLRRLHAELLEYCRDVEADATALVREVLAPVPRKLRRVWFLQTSLPMGCWAFYTVIPFIFEFVHGIPVGSLRRLSAMVYPEPCDMSGDLCYCTLYVAVAAEWFLASLAFSSVECTNLVYFTVATHLFEALGVSFSEVHADDALVLTGGVPACERSSTASPGERELRRCVQRHQTLLRWSKEMTQVYELPTFLRLGSMTVLIALGIIKPMLTENYVMDELPLVGFYGMQTIFIICWFSDQLSYSSSEVHAKAYMSHFERGGPEFRRSLDIVLTRTLRPVTTQAYWIKNVALRSFLDVLNRSYSSLQTIRAARKKGME